MYNLIVSGRSGDWNEPHFKLPVDRYLEHTDQILRERLMDLNPAAIAELTGIPTVFGYELGVREPARIGKILTIRQRQGEIRITFEFDNHMPTLNSEDLNKHAWEFDINKNEMYRHHWAVKDVDLFAALEESEIKISNPSYRPFDTIVGVKHIINFYNTDAQTIIKPTIFTVPPGPIDRELVAVMMPFEKAFDEVFSSIRAACENAKLRCQRVDELWIDAVVMQDVFSLIYKSHIVVVDFSTRNPNVFYETGIAHTLGKPVVPLAQTEHDVPFDLRHHRYLKYLNNSEGLKTLTVKLTDRLKTLSDLSEK